MKAIGNMKAHLSLIQGWLGRATKETEDAEAGGEEEKKFGGSACLSATIPGRLAADACQVLRMPRTLENSCRVTLASIHHSSSRALTKRQSKQQVSIAPVVAQALTVYPVPLETGLYDILGVSPTATEG